MWPGTWLPLCLLFGLLATATPVPEDHNEPSGVHGTNTPALIPTYFELRSSPQRGAPQIAAYATYKSFVSAIAGLAIHPYDETFTIVRHETPGVKVQVTIFALQPRPGEIQIPLRVSEGMWATMILAEHLVGEKPVGTETLTASYGTLSWRGLDVGGITVGEVKPGINPITESQLPSDTNQLTQRDEGIQPVALDLSFGSGGNDLQDDDVKVHISSIGKPFTRGFFVLSVMDSILALAAIKDKPRSENPVESFIRNNADLHSIVKLENQVPPESRQGIQFYETAVIGLAVLVEEMSKRIGQGGTIWLEAQFEIEVVGKGKVFKGSIELR